MKVMCDTNIILDVLLDRELFAEPSAHILRLCESGTIEGYTTASCITDVFYFVRKHLHSTERSYDAMEKLLSILRVCEVTDRHIREAVRLRRSDFEDALVVVCAKSVSCDCIVTRDRKGFTDSGVSFLSPEELIREIQKA